MFEKMRYRKCLKEKSKEFDCRAVAKALFERNNDRAESSDWQLNAAASAVFLSEVACDSKGRHLSTDVIFETGKRLRHFLNKETMRSLGDSVGTACMREHHNIVDSGMTKEDALVAMDGDAIFEQLSKDWNLPEQLTNIAGSIIGAVLIALIIKVIIWLIIYWWWNKS